MNNNRGLALALSLILLALLSLLGLAGARMVALELPLALGEELHVEAFQQALSELDNGQARETPGGPNLPPPEGSGYSADRFIAQPRVLEAGDETPLRQGVAVLHAAELSMPRSGLVSLGRDADGSIREARVQFRIAGDASALIIVRDSGETLWQAAAPEGIAASPALLDSDRDGVVDRLYLSGMGGTLWRADLAGDASQWRLTSLARHDRPLAFAPDVVQLRDDRGAYTVVIVATADFVSAVADRGSGSEELWRSALPSGENAASAPFIEKNRVWFATNSALHCVDLVSGAALRPPVALEPDSPSNPTWSERNDAAGCVATLKAGDLVLETRRCPRFRTSWQRLDT